MKFQVHITPPSPVGSRVSSIGKGEDREDVQHIRISILPSVSTATPQNQASAAQAQAPAANAGAGAARSVVEDESDEETGGFIATFLTRPQTEQKSWGPGMEFDCVEDMVTYIHRQSSHGAATTHKPASMSTPASSLAAERHQHQSKLQRTCTATSATATTSSPAPVSTPASTTTSPNVADKEASKVVALTVHFRLSNNIRAARGLRENGEWTKFCDGLTSFAIRRLILSVGSSGRDSLYHPELPGLVDTCWLQLVEAMPKPTFRSLTINPFYQFPKTIKALETLPHLESLELRNARDGDGYWVHWKTWKILGSTLPRMPKLQRIHLNDLNFVDCSWDPAMNDGASMCTWKFILESLAKVKPAREIVVGHWSAIGRSRGHNRDEATGTIMSEWMSSCIGIIGPTDHDKKKFAFYPTVNNAMKGVLDKSYESITPLDLITAIETISKDSVDQIHFVLRELGVARFAEMALAGSAPQQRIADDAKRSIGISCELHAREDASRKRPCVRST